MDKIAILYQAEMPPMINGIQKPMKPGGYSDSGADIAVELIKNNIKVITPVDQPDVFKDYDWVFPDSEEGIIEAIDKGANVFWLNTILYKGHPIEKYIGGTFRVIGQDPHVVDRFDDKWETNLLLSKNGLSIPIAVLIDDLKYTVPSEMQFPLVMKPLRGRGSQGVFMIANEKEFQKKLSFILNSKDYGDSVYVEPFLNGQEITITLMPKGEYKIKGKSVEKESPWCLPPVKRFNHENGIAPYNGIVAVMENSGVIDKQEIKSKSIKKVMAECIAAAELLSIKAPIRIDCRADQARKYFLFDVNLKPNMTGPSRGHRKNQDSLSLLAARAVGWDYYDLLYNMALQQWK